MSYYLDELRANAAFILENHEDPEDTHGSIDDLCENVVRLAASGHPETQEAAQIIADLLATEDREGWTRWYA